MPACGAITLILAAEKTCFPEALQAADVLLKCRAATDAPTPCETRLFDRKRVQGKNVQKTGSPRKKKGSDYACKKKGEMSCKQARGKEGEELMMKPHNV